MALGHLRSASFAARHFAAVHLHGPLVVSVVTPTPSGGVPFVRRPPLREFPPQPQPRIVEVEFFAEGEAFGRITLEPFTLVPLLEASARGEARAALGPEAAKATRMERLAREDDEVIGLF